MEHDHFSTREMVTLSLMGLGLFALSFCSFSKAQADWIKRRDGYQCQCPECTGHGGSLQAHHIVPTKLLEYQGIEPNTPMNGVSICQNHHDILHQTGNKAFETERGMVVWGSQWLGELSARAVENTRLAFAQGRRFPNGK